MKLYVVSSFPTDVELVQKASREVAQKSLREVVALGLVKREGNFCKIFTEILVADVKYIFFLHFTYLTTSTLLILGNKAP